MLIIPKKANYVVVGGEVFNPTAVELCAGRSAKWYLSQAGGLTQIGDKSAVFVVRADGRSRRPRIIPRFGRGIPLMRF